MSTDSHDILGVPRDASAAEIEKRFRFLSQAYAPDKFATPDQRAEAQVEFRRIQSAYYSLRSAPVPESISSPPDPAPKSSLEAGNEDHSVFNVKPGYNTGGTGKFLLVASPCRFEFVAGRSALLFVHRFQPGTVWIALFMTILTVMLLSVFLAVLGGPVPGLLLSFFVWYWVIRQSRRQRIEINLATSGAIVADEEKREVGMCIGVEGKDTWISVKCGSRFDDILHHLQSFNGVSVKMAALRAS